MQSSWTSQAMPQPYPGGHSRAPESMTPRSLASLLQPNGITMSSEHNIRASGPGLYDSRSQTASRAPSFSGPSAELAARTQSAYPPVIGSDGRAAYDWRANSLDGGVYGRQRFSSVASSSTTPGPPNRPLPNPRRRLSSLAQSHRTQARTPAVPDGQTASPPEPGEELDDETANEDETPDASGEGGQEKKRKKRRVAAFTCEQCTKRKQKCNKVIPCQHCIARGIGDQCVLYIPEWLTAPQPDYTPPKRKRRKTTASIVARDVGPGNGSGSGDAEGEGSAQGVEVVNGFAHGTGQGSGNGNTGFSDAEPSGSKRISRNGNIDRGGMPNGEAVSFDQGGQNGEWRAAEGKPRGSVISSEQIYQPSAIPPGRQSADPYVQPDKPLIATRGGSLASKLDGQDETGFRIEMLSRMRHLEDLLSAQNGASQTRVDSNRVHMSALSLARINTVASTGHDLEDSSPISPVLRRLLRNAGIASVRLSELIADLPPYSFSRALVDQFFSNINAMRYPIHESSLRKALDEVYQRKDIGGPDPENLKNLPLIFIILATSVIRAPEPLAGSREERKLTSLKMYWNCRRAFLLAATIQPESLELVVAGLLLTVYLIQIHDRRLTEAWSILGASVRTAQAIGCHRDGAKLGLDSVATEYRRRIWSNLFHADRHYSLILGRPPSISEAYTDVLAPSNIELEEIILDRPVPSKPLTEPTRSTFMVLRHRFAVITGQIAHHFQQLHQAATYSEVEALDAALLAFVDELPPHYRIDGPDTSLDTQKGYLPRHRYSLATEILFIRIILHRPWLLRKFWNNKYALSRRACSEAAKQDFRLRQSFRKNHPSAAAQIHGQFREFNSAMIAGISAIISPRGSDAEEMRQILTAFLDRHPMNQEGDAPHATQKENAIIYTLYRRSLQVLENVGVDANALQPGSDPVALLLGLRGEDVTAEPLRSGPEPGDDSYYSQPAFGEEKSTAVMVRDIYATMVRKGMVDRLPKKASDRESASRPVSEMAQTPPVEPGHSEAKRHSTKIPMAISAVQSDPMFFPEVEEDPQHLFDHWLTTNSFLAGASNGMSSVGLGEGNFAPVSDGFPYVPGLEAFYPALNPSGAAQWNGQSFVETAYPGPHLMTAPQVYSNVTGHGYQPDGQLLGDSQGVPLWQ